MATEQEHIAALKATYAGIKPAFDALLAAYAAYRAAYVAASADGITGNAAPRIPRVIRDLEIPELVITRVTKTELSRVPTGR